MIKEVVEKMSSISDLTEVGFANTCSRRSRNERQNRSDRFFLRLIESGYVAETEC